MSQPLILRRPAVQQRTGLSRSAIYALIRQHRFPKPISLTGKAVRWLEADVVVWIAERVAARPPEARP